jgi:hypothetical protein
VAFERIPLLVVIDDTKRWCSAVVPELKSMLEHRGFVVNVHRMQDGPVKLAGHKAVLIGAPTFGAAIKARPPTESFATYIEAIDGLDEVQMGVFTVYNFRTGDAIQRLKGLVLRVGARYIAGHAYSRQRPKRGAHILPAECMVRVR